MTGMIFDIQRFSIHDGPGIRTTVFFKGCSMACQWCHNPESISNAAQLSFVPDKCIGCGYCFNACVQKVHQMIDEQHDMDRGKCISCGKCTKECYAQALEMVGRSVTVDEILLEVLKDKAFYESSRGGMTVSGGEPTCQSDFLLALLKKGKDAKLNQVIETNGNAKWEVYDRIRPFIDLFLFDWKETDPDKHKACTGISNTDIRENLKKLHGVGEQILLRCPIIPGLNDREDHFEGIAAIVNELNNLIGVELIPFHGLGESKIERFGFEQGKCSDVVSPSGEMVEGWKKELRTLGVDIK